MGLFDFFKKKPQPEIKPVVHSEPEPAPKKIKDGGEEAYRITFYKELGAVPEFSKAELDEMYRIISADDGHQNMSRYYQPVFLKFFFNRHWTWAEYDRWAAICEKLNQRPVRWISFSNVFNLDVEKNVGRIIEELKVAEIKEVLAFLNVEVPAKAKKAELIALTLAVPGLDEKLNGYKLIEDIYTEQKLKVGYGRYSEFMKHVMFRAKSLEDRNRALKLGIKKFEFNLMFKEDQPFVDIALKEDKNALTPLFPNDSSFRTVIIDGFDD